MSQPDLLYLSADEVPRALPMSDAIESMRGAFRELTEGKVTLPVRACLPASGEKGVNLVMPCYSEGSGLFSTKTVTVFPGNRQRGRPTTQGLLILTDGTTGSHLAMMDGTSLTAIRTGAASGLATDLMARADASSVALFGAGAQARTQLEAVCCVRPIRRARVYSPGRVSAERFAAEMSERLQIPIESAATPSETLESADIICTATPSTSPVFSGEDLSPGAHINAVGAYRPDMVEIPPSVVRQAKVVVDHHASALEEAGDLLMPLQAGLIEADHFKTELGELVAGRPSIRRDEEEITLFKSVGVAIQDLRAAETALGNARRLSLGISLA